MPSSWSNKRERQYEHIKESSQKRGKSAGTAKRIAAATVNKTRSEKGETKGSRRASSSTSGRTTRSGSSARGGRKTTSRSRTSSGRGGSRAQKVRAGRKGGRASAKSRKRS